MSNSEADIQIDSALFYQKIDRIYSEWRVIFFYYIKTQTEMKDVIAVIVILGKCPDIEETRPYSEIFQ